MVCKGLGDDTINILIGGEAGQGITRSGSLLGRALMRGGLHVFGTNEYPSLIRGGHNYYLLRASARDVNSHIAKLDVVVALNKETALLHESQLNDGGYIVVDDVTEFNDGDLKRMDAHLYKIPMTTIVKDLGGPDIMRNTVALGGVLRLLGLDHTILMDLVASTFAKKEVAEMNLTAIDRGYNYAKEHHYGSELKIENLETGSMRIFLTGNDSIALGAISAGCRFYAAYPMTPASAILDYMMAHDDETGMVVIQTESELAAMNMVVGAGYTGLRAMTATSGGGFSLMAEALGLAAMTETPIVVNIGQRPGPSTGLATHSAQGDLLFAIHASQGEFPRVVVAPGDVEECFYLTKHAFNLADVFQIPVLIITDKYLVESEKDTVPFDADSVPIKRGKFIELEKYNGNYKRYQLTGDGVSPRALPGTTGVIVSSNSNEHRDTGYSNDESKAVTDMVDKRFMKLPYIIDAVSKLEPARIFGSEKAEVTIVGWGGTKGPILEAIIMLRNQGIQAKMLQVVFMEPFPAQRVKEELSKSKVNILFENNKTAQLSTLIKLHTGISIENISLRYDGRPFDPTEIMEKVLELIKR